MAHKTNPGFNVAVVGAGFGGLAVAIALKTKWGLDDFVTLVELGEITPTLHGCASDVPIHFYSLSTDLKSDWKRSHGTQPEILEYMRKVTDKYGLRKHCRFHTSLDKAEWDGNANLWRIETRDVRTGETQVTHATAIIAAIGVLVVPKFPKLQGIESFKGEVFHSARWKHDVNLHGKRVGVLGNGSSASQFIPIISKDPTVSVVNFARTKMWYVPGPLIPYRETTKWIFAHIPFVQRIYRFMIAVVYEVGFLAFKGKGDNYVGKYRTKIARDYVKKIAPSKYHHLIIPKYPLGCRRLVRDQGYLDSLSRPNVHLTFDHIKHVESDGVVTETGEKVNLDVIIYGTGFVTDNYPLNVHGPRGTLKEYNDAHGGPAAYLGTTVPGPNTTTGHTSVIFSEESQVPYILQLLAPIRCGALTSVVPTDAATDKYNDMLQERLDDSVWTQCASWYRAGAQGRIFSTFPGPLVLFWWWLRKPRWDDFEVEGPGADAWRRRHASRAGKVQEVTFTLVAALGVLASVVYRKGMGLSELGGEAVRMWTTLWDLLVVGAGTA
ncbi:FAD/NAD-P-binding domain-containing protein [Lactarius indigo]|nr:FAD/NAD-P-binding domain-containing protein [Lactarius indigo]